jgi:hypothetical protein
MEQERNFSETLNEFVKQWDQLRMDVGEFLKALKSNADPYDKGEDVMFGSSRLNILANELMAFHKRINRQK